MSKKTGAAAANNNFIDFLLKTPRKLTFTALYRYYFDFILRLLYRIIEIDNVPETVSETFLKMTLYTQGKACFFRGKLIGKNEPELLALNCARAEMPTVYYMYRNVIVANPRLQQAYNMEIDKECVVVYLSEADKYQFGEYGGGLYELIRRTAIMLADNDISINIAQKNTRLTNIVSGDTQNTVDSIRAVIAAMYEGDPSIVVQSSLIDKLQGIPIVENTSQQNLVQLIEVQQYIISHFYEQIGICTHDQMKRERLITAEINDNLDLAFLNIDDILYSLNQGFDKVNTMFGTELKARINPIIERQRQRADAAAEAQLENGGELPALTDAQSEDQNSAQSDELDRETIREAAALIVSRILSKAEQPEEEQPEEEQFEEEQPAEEQPEEEQPEEEQPEEEQPEEEQPEEEQPEEEQPEEEQPEEEQPAEEQPEEEQPEEEQPEEEQPEEIAGNITLEVSGDNNIIVIGGDLDDSTPEPDALADVGSDNEGGADGK